MEAVRLNCTKRSASIQISSVEGAFVFVPRKILDISLVVKGRLIQPRTLRYLLNIPTEFFVRFKNFYFYITYPK